MGKTEPHKTRSRILRFLAKGAAVVAVAAARDKVLLNAGERGTISVGRELLAKMARSGELALGGGQVTLAMPAEARENRRDIGTVTIQVGGGRKRLR